MSLQEGFNYYDMLLAATSTTIGVAAVIGCRWFILRRKKQKWKQQRDSPKMEHELEQIKSKLAELSKGVSTLKRALFYMAIFLYPVLNLRIFQVFVCRDVSGVRYLRCDFSVRCDTPSWYSYTIYCGLWIVVYTVGFPFIMASFLKRHAQHIKAHHEDVLDSFYKEVRRQSRRATNLPLKACFVPLVVGL